MSQKIRLRYEELAAIQLCNFSSMGVLARSIFGSSDKPTASHNPKQDFNLIGTSGDINQDVAAIKQMLRVG